MNGWMDGWIGGWIDGWIDGLVDGLVDGQMYGWNEKDKEQSTHVLVLHMIQISDMRTINFMKSNNEKWKIIITQT